MNPHLPYTTVKVTRYTRILDENGRTLGSFQKPEDAAHLLSLLRSYHTANTALSSELGTTRAQFDNLVEVNGRRTAELTEVRRQLTEKETFTVEQKKLLVGVESELHTMHTRYFGLRQYTDRLRAVVRNVRGIFGFAALPTLRRVANEVLPE